MAQSSQHQFRESIGIFGLRLDFGLGLARLVYILLPFLSILGLFCGSAAVQGQGALKVLDVERVQDRSLRVKVNAGRLCGLARLAFFLLKTLWFYLIMAYHVRRLKDYLEAYYLQRQVEVGE